MSEPPLPHTAVVLRDTFAQTFEGMRLLREARLMQPYLAVVYSTIDAAAWLTADHDSDVSRRDFVSWVEQFLLPESGLGCTALDLYSARCGILHTFSAYSSLQRQGQARLVTYAWGSANAQELQELMERMHPGEIAVVHLDVLGNALFKGWERNLSALEQKPEAVRRLAHRASHLFSNVGKEPVERALRYMRNTNG